MTAVEQVSSPSVYKYLAEAEVFLPGMGITPDEDLFARRDRLYMAHTTQPLDEVAAAALEEVPLPQMRLDVLLRKVQKRPDTQHEVSVRVSAFDRLSEDTVVRGRGGPRAREAAGGLSRGHGGRGGCGYQGGRGGREEYSRFRPYHTGQRRGW